MSVWSIVRGGILDEIDVRIIGLATMDIWPNKYYCLILRYVLVRGDAINREPGENPGQTRYCDS